ncbi:MAG: hypothetical protein U0324_06800 [Polyangiales bacterium]
MASGEAQTALRARAVAAGTDPSLRPSAAWAMGEGEGDVPGLLAALGDSDAAVVANAAASLGRLAARGVAVDAGDALCRTLQAWRHPAVVANALRALGSVRGGSCVVAAVTRALGRHPEPLVREAALAAALTRAGDDAAYGAAVSRCAAADPSPTLAEACQRASLATPTQREARAESVDAQVVDASGEPMERTAFGLVLPERWIRMGTTGPGGWVHARPTGAGRFVVVAPGISRPTGVTVSPPGR